MLFNLSDVVTSYRPQYDIPIVEYRGQEVIYNGHNFIITLVKEGRRGEPCLVMNNGFSVEDPFFSTIKPEYENCWIYAYYYKLSNPEESYPKRWRVRMLLSNHKELFGCEGLIETGKELYQVLSQLKVPVVLVGHSKSATMICEALSLSQRKELFSLIAISPIFRGTFSTMLPLMEEYLGRLVYPFKWILTEHIVDKEISVGSSYMEWLRRKRYLDCSEFDLQIIASTLDKTVSHKKLEEWKPCNWFRFISPLMDYIIREEEMEGDYKSDCFLPFLSQYPLPFYFEGEVNLIYSSLAGSFSHPVTHRIIQDKIDEKNRNKNVFKF